MPTGTITKTFSCPGYTTITANVERSADNASIWGGPDSVITLNAAHQMSSYAEGDANVVTGNLPGSHGQTDGTFDFYWKESGVEKCRYGVPVTIVTNAITTTNVGVGDAFPTTPDAQPILCKQKVVTTLLDGDAVVLWWAALLFGNQAATGRGHAAFQETAGTAVGAVNITGVLRGTAVYDADITGGQANALTGNVIGKCVVTHNDLVYIPTFQMVAIADTTP